MMKINILKFDVFWFLNVGSYVFYILMGINMEVKYINLWVVFI